MTCVNTLFVPIFGFRAYRRHAIWVRSACASRISILKIRLQISFLQFFAVVQVTSSPKFACVSRLTGVGMGLVPTLGRLYDLSVDITRTVLVGHDGN